MNTKTEFKRADQKSPRRRALIFHACLLAAAGVPGMVSGAVVTSNNLQTTALSNMTAPANTQVSQGVATVTNALVGLNADVVLTNPPSSPVNNYIIDRFGTSQDLGNFVQTSTYSATHNLTQAIVGTSALTYSLNVSAFLNVSFSATNILYRNGVGADAGLISGFSGNLVPNASFEDASINFFRLGSIVADAAKQGSNVLKNLSTLESYVAIPVIPGRQYAFSYWYSGNTTGGGDAEYGLSVPGDGNATGAGNTANFIGVGVTPWTEATGTFTPGAGQTLFYMGGMDNGGFIEMDSFFLAAIPEPASLGILSLGTLLLSRRRA